MWLHSSLFPFSPPGLCKALPEIVSMEPANDLPGCVTLHPSRAESLGAYPLLGCPSLKKVNISWLTLPYDVVVFLAYCSDICGTPPS